jgi:hypothetical protein
MTENEKIIALLEKQNGYLQTVADILRKEHREARTARIVHALMIIIPTVAVFVLGYYAWTAISHYLDVLNNNVNALKSNFDAMTEFFSKLIPDFSKIGPQLEQTWQDIQFWK